MRDHAQHGGQEHQLGSQDDHDLMLAMCRQRPLSALERFASDAAQRQGLDGDEAGIQAVMRFAKCSHDDAIVLLDQENTQEN